MVVGTVVAVGIVIGTGGAAAPAVISSAVVAAEVGAMAGTAGVGAVVGGASASAAVAGAAGVGAASGAIAGAGAGAAGAAVGAVTGSSAAGAAVGAVAGSSAAVGVSGVGTGAVGLATTGLATGPIGLLVVGNEGDNQATYDCWKRVLHDHSTERSSGMLLKNLCTHPCISTVSITAGGVSDLPDILLENIWNEKFKIEYFLLPENNKIVCHANLL